VRCAYPEGLMFRNIDSPYQGKRSAHLQKYKKFDDAEFKVIGYEEAQGKDAGTVIWILETVSGEQFRARPKGTLAERAEMFNTVSRKPETYIGKMMTIKYFGLTDAGIPRFPIAIALRNYE
jgi:DNA ligase-1